MPRNGLCKRTYASWTAGLLLTSALCACNNNGTPAPAPSDSGSASADAAPPAALPLSTTTPATYTTAPPVTALPAGGVVRRTRFRDPSEGYHYLDDASYQENAVEDAPPDYSFDDGGVRPWTWDTSDGSRVITEPVAGGYRTYYYHAGSDYPYLVRDPQYAYAYDGGALASVYTLNGVEIDINSDSAPVLYAGRYASRGNDLWRHASSGQHMAVNAYAWSDRRADLSAQRVAWQRNIASNPQWSAWDAQHRDDEQNQWGEVRQQHQQAAQQFGGWQQQHFQGSPPQLYGNQGHSDHTAAIVGGVVAAGVAATAVHAVMGNRNEPHRDGGPGPVPQQGAQYAPAAASGHRPGNGQPMTAPGYAAHPVHGGAAPTAQHRPEAEPAYAAHPHQPARSEQRAPVQRPSYVAPPHAEHATPTRYVEPQAAPVVHRAPVEHAAPEMHSAPAAVERPAPHYAEPARPAGPPHPAPHPQEHGGDHREHRDNH